MSSDKPEEKKEQVEARKPLEAPAKEAVIGASPQQERWKLMEQAHYLDQNESATHLFNRPGEERKATEKFQLVDSAAAKSQTASSVDKVITVKTAEQAAELSPEMKAEEKPQQQKPTKQTIEPLTTEYLREKAGQGNIWARSFMPEIEKAEKLPAGPIRDQELENVLKRAAVIFRPGDHVKAQPKLVEENQSQTSTGTIISRQAEKNPVLAPVKAHYDWTNKLEPGPERDAHRQLAREQLVQAEPQTKDELERLDRRRRLAEQEDCGEHEAWQPREKILQGNVEYPEREIEGVRRLTPEDLRKLAKAMEAGPGAAEESLKQTANEILVRTGESTRDTMLAGIKLVIGLLEYDRDLILNPERARKNAGQAGEALGVLAVAGVSITAGGVGYADTVSKSGDYSLPLKHISEVVNRWYDRQSPADQMAIVAEVSAGFGLSAGAVEANKLRKPGAFMEFLKEGVESLPRNPEAERKAIEAISKLFRRVEPVVEKAGAAGSKISDVVQEAQEKGIMDHIMEMREYYLEGEKHKKGVTKLAKELEITAKEVHQMTDAELALLRLERIQEGYRTVFYRAHPQLKGTGLEVHHALPQTLLDRFPGMFKAKEIHSLEYLRGIPESAMKDGKSVHQLITQSWKVFLADVDQPTREQVLKHMRELDDQYGQYFNPPLK